MAWFECEPDLATARNHSEAQSRRARRPRGKLQDGKTLEGVVEQLAREHPDERPKEIWPRLHGKLDKLHLSPKEETSPGGDVQLLYGEPNEDGKRKHLTLRRFGMRIAAARKKMSR